MPIPVITTRLIARTPYLPDASQTGSAITAAQSFEVCKPVEPMKSF